MTYYPVFKDARKILKELHLLLTPDQAHKRVFSEVPIIGFKNAKSLKDHLVRAVLPQLDREGRSKPCEGANRSCEVCDSVKDTTKFKKAESEETFDILKGPLDCNSNNVIFDCIANWCVTLIDQVEDKKELRKKELYWINKLNTWAPVGLNVREVYEAY